MRAAYFERQGEARAVLEIGDVPVPAPGMGEVRVRVAFSGVNPSDVYARSGSRGGPLPWERVIPHQDGSGTIDAVGLGVHQGRLGERVWVYQAQKGGPFGTAAEWVVVPTYRAISLPTSMSLEQGACLGTPWMTAYGVAMLDETPPTGTILIPGARGAVANYLAQLAAEAGATVIATVRSKSSAAAAAAGGAHVVVDVTEQNALAEVRAALGGGRVDRVYESRLAANLAMDVELLRDGGVLVVYGTDDITAVIPVSPAIRKQLAIRFVYAYSFAPAVYRAAARRLAELAEPGRLRHLPVQVFELEDIAAAHRSVEMGNHGVRSLVRLGG